MIRKKINIRLYVIQFVMELEAEAMEAVATMREAKASFIILSMGDVDGDSLVAIGGCF